MAQHTTNYNLEKQQGNDLVNINGINNNFDIIDTEINEAQNRMQKAVGTLSELKAVTGVPENTTILCKGLGLYRYDASSAATPDDFFIVAPSLGAGRWILMAETAMGFSADTGSTNAYVLTLPGLSAYYTGMMVWFKPVNGNTGACTINVNTLGAKSLVRPGGVALTSGDITAGALICAVYDGTNFQLISLLAANLVHLTATQTLTNKTLTSPILTTPKFATAGYITDANGNELIRFPSTVASAVNEITVNNAATGVPPSIQSSGSDTNVGLDIKSKGTGTIRNYVNNVVSVVFDAAASAVNSLTMKSNTTNNSPSIEAAGIDTNVGIDVKTKGTGVFRALVNGVVAFVVDTVAGAVNYLTVKANTAGNAPAIMATGNDTNIDVNVVPKGTGRLKENGTAVIRQGEDYRPNILLNGDFKINSQGKTSYSGGGTCVDKWAFYGTNSVGTITVGTDYITITAPNTSDTYIIQSGIKINSNMIGRKLTLSFCDSNNNIYSATGILPSSVTDATSITFPDGVAYFNNELDGTMRVVLAVNANKAVNVKWIKIEQNDHATPFISKSYKEELLNISDNVGYAPNLLINGNFSVWQRGISFDRTSTVGIFYGPDRWAFYRNNAIAGLIVNRINNGVTILNPNNSSYAIASQSLERGDVIPLRDKTVTFSVKIKSSVAATCSLQVNYSNTGEIVHGGASTGYIASKAINVGTSYSTFSVIFVVPSDALGLNPYIFMPAIAATYTIEYIKLEVNDHATPFVPRSYGEELALCQRYYQNIEARPTIPQSQRVVGNSWLPGVYFSVVMRVAPTVIIKSAGTGTVGKVSENQGGTDIGTNCRATFVSDTGFIYVVSDTALPDNTYGYSYIAVADAEI